MTFSYIIGILLGKRKPFPLAPNANLNGPATFHTRYSRLAQSEQNKDFNVA